MKMTQRIISMLLAVVMLFGAMPPIFAAASTLSQTFDGVDNEVFEEAASEGTSLNQVDIVWDAELTSDLLAATPPISVGSGGTRYTVLLLDVETKFKLTSNGSTIYTVSSPIDIIKKAANRFVEQMQNANGTNNVAIVSFHSSANVESAFTDDSEILTTAIDGISIGSGRANINDAYLKAESLLDSISDENVSKNIVLFMQAAPAAGEYSDTGRYSKSDSTWYNTKTNIYDYQHANSTYTTAARLMQKYNLYSIGLFQNFDSVPQKGKSYLKFCQKLCKDLQNAGHQEVDDVNDLEFAFGDVADDITFELNGHRYKLFSNCTTWEEAETYCESLGGYLATINSSEENEFLYNYISSNGIQNAYFGLSDTAEDGVWKWVTDETTRYTNWHSGEPNSESSNEDYGMFYYKYPDGTWNDGNFGHGTVGDNSPIYFICEWGELEADNYRLEISPAENLTVEVGQTLAINCYLYNGDELVTDWAHPTISRAGQGELEYVEWTECENGYTLILRGVSAGPVALNIYHSESDVELHVSVEVTLTDDTVIDGEFSYLAYNNSIGKYTFHYDESWFHNSSYTYQHELAKMSMRVTMAAGDVTAAGRVDRTENIRELMGKLGFAFSKEFSSYPVPEYKTNDTIGYAIGSKEIEAPNGEKSTLIMIAVRGSGYGAEWGSNFKIGTSIEHESFRTAADQVINALESYIVANRDSFNSRIKVWISGYSRAGATTNLLGAYLDDGNIEQVAPEDVFAFCFECPQNTTSLWAIDHIYDNIVNIINPIDLVPKVAMSAWGFKRFGTDYTLPSMSATSWYIRYKAEMMNAYKAILAYGSSDAEAWLNTVNNTREASGQASIYDTFASDLAYATRSRSTYVRNYQSTIMDAFAIGMGGADGELDIGIVIHELLPALPGVLSYNSGEFVKTLIFKEMHNAHNMELCLAWLESLDGLTETDYKTYHKIFVNCPVDVAVYCRGELVGNIVADNLTEIENGNVAYIDANGQKVIILPTDAEYTIKLTATDDGKMTYTVTDYNMSTGSTERITSYHEVEIAEGDQLTGIIEDLSNTADAEYSLVLPNGDNVVPSFEQQGDEIASYTVNVSAGAGGSVIGGGYYVCGEFAKVTATAEDGYLFAGWYVGENLVSEEAEYRFAVMSDIEVVARFAEDDPIPPTITGSWTTDLVMSAADLGVSAPDAVLRATFTFNEDGTSTTIWEAVDLTAFRIFFHDMFVNAYYAMAYGAGITDLAEIEQFCMDSTGMSVSDYMDTLVTDEAMRESFTPAPTSGAYRLNEDQTELYTDMAIMDVPSNPDVANSFVIGDSTMYLNAASYGKPDYTFVCTRVK